MIKVLGAVLIIGASTLYGFYRAYLYAERPRQIRQLIHAVSRLRTEIWYGSTPLPAALSKLSQLCAKPLDRMFLIISERLQAERTATVHTVWSETIKQMWGQTAMKQPEKEALLELGAVLGVSDREDQLQHLKLAQTHLEHEEAAAKDEQVRYEKLSRSLGLLGGALIVILIY